MNMLMPISPCRNCNHNDHCNHDGDSRHDDNVNDDNGQGDNFLFFIFPKKCQGAPYIANYKCSAEWMNKTIKKIFRYLLHIWDPTKYHQLNIWQNIIHHIFGIQPNIPISRKCLRSHRTNIRGRAELRSVMGGVEPRNGGGEGSHAIQCGGIAAPCVLAEL